MKNTASSVNMCHFVNNVLICIDLNFEISD